MSGRARAATIPKREAEKARETGTDLDDDGDGSFETSLERLTQVVDRLESGELGLEESLALFEEGVRLSRSAKDRLDKAEKRVEELIESDENGDPVSRELEPE
jgi:exodeoxyribonuclease VII small subunit